MSHCSAKMAEEVGQGVQDMHLDHAHYAPNTADLAPPPPPPVIANPAIIPDVEDYAPGTPEREAVGAYIKLALERVDS